MKTLTIIGVFIAVIVFSFIPSKAWQAEEDQEVSPSKISWDDLGLGAPVGGTEEEGSITKQENIVPTQSVTSAVQQPSQAVTTTAQETTPVSSVSAAPAAYIPTASIPQAGKIASKGKKSTEKSLIEEEHQGWYDSVEMTRGNPVINQELTIVHPDKE